MGPIYIPPWVPLPIRRQVKDLSTDDEHARAFVIAQRLAAAPAMRYVWRELKDRGDDVALSQFFIIACDCATRTLPPFYTRTECALSATVWSGGAALCRSEQESMAAKNSLELAAALERVAQHFETVARRWDRIDERRLIGKRSRDDDARAYVRVLGDVTEKLFGTTLYRSVATVATIALGRNMSWGLVRQWCELKKSIPSAILNPGK
jgi:hypothetical protein